MPDQEFLETYGLYRKLYIRGCSGWLLTDVPDPSIQVHCPQCEEERTFRRTRRSWGMGEQKTVGGQIVVLVYTCAFCDKGSIAFVLRFDGDAQAPGTDSPPTDASEILRRLIERQYVMKIGQYPAWSITPPKEIRTALGEHEPLYRRGRICEDQGYGIGAFAYYRRIVENVIDQLLSDIGELLEPQDQTTCRTALEKLGASTVAAKKIEVVKDMLPNSLRPGNMNPLQRLHDALSVGIHTLDEEECLTLAEGIRVSLVMLSKHIALAKQEKEEYGTKMQTIVQKLDKIKRQQGEA